MELNGPEGEAVSAEVRAPSPLGLLTTINTVTDIYSIRRPLLKTNQKNTAIPLAILLNINRL